MLLTTQSVHLMKEVKPTEATGGGPYNSEKTYHVIQCRGHQIVGNVPEYRPTVSDTQEYLPRNGKTHGRKDVEAGNDARPRDRSYQTGAGNCIPGSWPLWCADMVAQPEWLLLGVPKAGQQIGTASQRNRPMSPKRSGGTRVWSVTGFFPTQQPTAKVRIRIPCCPEITTDERHPPSNTTR